MKKNDFKKVNIQITGEENDTKEIIYNNLISNLNLTEEEQIKYLKNKAMMLEIEIKNKRLTFLLSLISIIGISLGITLLINDLYLLGIVFIAVTFIGVILRFSLMCKNMIESHGVPCIHFSFDFAASFVYYEKVTIVSRLLRN